MELIRVAVAKLEAITLVAVRHPAALEELLPVKSDWRITLRQQAKDTKSCLKSTSNKAEVEVVVDRSDWFPSKLDAIQCVRVKRPFTSDRTPVPSTLATDGFHGQTN